uniref:Uncharacterized protein n=1 Tax=Mola mola TaxID=94237 RepID=A0A3Q3VMY2_MOLML
MSDPTFSAELWDSCSTHPSHFCTEVEDVAFLYAVTVVGVFSAPPERTSTLLLCRALILILHLSCPYVKMRFVLPLGTDTSNVVVIFDLRRRRFLCMDLKGKLYKSVKECFFQHIWFGSENPHRHLFYSVSGGRLLKLEAAELGVSRQEQPEPSSALWERFLGPLVRRQRRSEEVNPSDPLRSQSHPSHPVKDHKDAGHRQPEQDQTGAVSKETITSCDDPLLTAVSVRVAGVTDIRV